MRHLKTYLVRYCYGNNVLYLSGNVMTMFFDKEFWEFWVQNNSASGSGTQEGQIKREKKYQIKQL